MPREEVPISVLALVTEGMVDKFGRRCLTATKQVLLKPPLLVKPADTFKKALALVVAHRSFVEFDDRF